MESSLVLTLPLPNYISNQITLFMVNFFLRRLFLLILCPALPLGLFAQGQDENYDWVGNSLSDVVGSSDPDMQTVYLYNVGTGKFLNGGGYWATVTVGFPVGMGINIKNSTTASGKYQMTGDTNTTEGQHIAFGRRIDTLDPNNIANYNRAYVDRGVELNGHPNGILDWTFTETSSGSKTYTIHCFNDEQTAGMYGNRYLRLITDATATTLTMEYPNNVQNNDLNSQWKIVTLADLKNAFNDAFASDESPADATFLIADQNFNRSNIYVKKWVIAGGLTESYNSNNYSFNPGSTSPGGAHPTYYVGMGAASSNNYQTEYASFWMGNVRNVNNNNHANGTVTQTVRILKKGWYILSCDGFYNANTGSGLKSSFFAKVAGSTAGESNVTIELNKFNHEFNYTMEDLTKNYNNENVSNLSPYVKAGKLFEDGKYQNSLIVYVPADNTDLNIGVEITGSNHSLDWTTFDNFQLKYCGDRDLILDEMQTATTYIEKQVEANVAKTLILKRTMTPGIWNSITLPVALTAAQFKTAFGEQAKLSTLKGQNETILSRIDFKSVDLSNDAAIVMQPNKLYIMQPTRQADVLTGSHTKIIETGSSLTVQAPYYVINNVTLDTAPEAVFKEISKPSTTSDEKLQFCGTQIRQTTNFVPKYSYVLGATDGKWYYTQNDLPIKGFRCWIATGSEAQAKNMTFAIDGVTDETTVIDAVTTNDRLITTDNNVYTLSGQLVRVNTSSLEGLPKGIYVVNNKKFIVK